MELHGPGEQEHAPAHGEGYFAGFDHARAATEAPGALGLPVMAERLDGHARAFRSLSKEDALKRASTAYERMLDIAEGLTDEEWTSLLVAHPYLGPVPAGFHPEFQLIDYAVHSWDIRERTGSPRPWQATRPTCWCPWR